VSESQAGKESELDDSYIRKNAIKYKVLYITTLAGARAAAKGVAAGFSPFGGACPAVSRPPAVPRGD
jgi:hypothetical protein